MPSLYLDIQHLARQTREYWHGYLLTVLLTAPSRLQRRAAEILEAMPTTAEQDAAELQALLQQRRCNGGEPGGWVEADAAEAGYMEELILRYRLGKKLLLAELVE